MAPSHSGDLLLVCTRSYSLISVTKIVSACFVSLLALQSQGSSETANWIPFLLIHGLPRCHSGQNFKTVGLHRYSLVGRKYLSYRYWCMWGLLPCLSSKYQKSLQGCRLENIFLLVYWAYLICKLLTGNKHGTPWCHFYCQFSFLEYNLTLSESREKSWGSAIDRNGSEGTHEKLSLTAQLLNAPRWILGAMSLPSHLPACSTCS